mmetsp:Transcript_100049/g.287433  ORF Transcript_100049/g.287433 Transcript_100049/m.287433 type:complete len:215 (+) Transcript_100049:359-1003(+)
MPIAEAIVPKASGLLTTQARRSQRMTTILAVWQSRASTLTSFARTSTGPHRRTTGWRLRGSATSCSSRTRHCGMRSRRSVEVHRRDMAPNATQGAVAPLAAPARHIRLGCCRRHRLGRRRCHRHCLQDVAGEALGSLFRSLRPRRRLRLRPQSSRPSRAVRRAWLPSIPRRRQRIPRRRPRHGLRGICLGFHGCHSRLPHHSSSSSSRPRTRRD